MADTTRRDIGRFTIVPEWVVRRGFSARALRLYVELGFHADYLTGECFPSHSTLATRLKCSVDTVQRAQAELEAGQAIHVERRFDAKGDRTSNLFTVFTVDPIGDGIGPISASRKSAATQPQNGTEGSRTDAAVTRTNNETPAAVDFECERCHGTGWFIPDVEARNPEARKCDHRLGALAGGQPVKENA